MRKSAKIVSAVAVAGLAFAASAAYTGTGLTNSAGDTQFVGGQVIQTVTGATLSNLAYTFTDSTNTAVSSVDLTFADDQSDGKTVTLELTGGSAAIFECTVIAVDTNTSNCVLAAAQTAPTGVTGATVAVS